MTLFSRKKVSKTSQSLFYPDLSPYEIVDSEKELSEVESTTDQESTTEQEETDSTEYISPCVSPEPNLESEIEWLPVVSKSG